MKNHEKLMKRYKRNVKVILSQKEEIRDSSNDGRNLKEKKKNDKSMLTYG